jgi:uncharacterized small protein (DUF1192 family)
MRTLVRIVVGSIRSLALGLALVLAVAPVAVLAAAPAPSSPRARADAVSGPSPGAREHPGGDDVEELKEAVAELQKELSRLKEGGGAGGAQAAELERRIDLLALEIEKLRTGGAVEETPLQGTKGLGPAASTVYRKDRGVAVGGYGEALYTNYAELRQDDQPSGQTDELDFLRAVFYVGYKFSDSILFNSEIEIEHASTDQGGSVSVEFAYLEFQKRPEIGLRAGMLLVPVGFINELHEPPIFHGARRPEVERAIIPTTWRENGAGLFGAAGPFEYRGYAVVGLRSSGFSAAGIRGGRQKGAKSRAEDFALTGRLDLVGVPGLLLGGSFYTGNSGQGATVEDRRIQGRVTLFDLHGQYESRGLQLRALWTRSTVGDVPLINVNNELSGDESVGEVQGGWYVEAAFDVMSLAPKGRWSIIPFVRYEELGTQKEVPAPWETNPAWERSLLTGGLEIKPIPQVVFKLDYQVVKDDARTGSNRFNVAMGYLF